MSSNEWLPAQIPFDLVRRGFAPDQVTAHLERLEYDLRIATANGDATNQRLFEVSSQLQSAQAEVEDLRSQLDNLAREPVSMTGLSNRMQRMIRLAEEEAAEIRARANTDAEKVRNNAAAMAAATASEREIFDTERERTRRQLADQVRDLLSEATTEAENTRQSAAQESQAMVAAATAEAERLVGGATAESRATLNAAREEATNTLASARAESTATLTAARAAAEHTLTSAREEAEALTNAANAERLRLDTESNDRRNAIDEDFEIAISARRAEAHQRLTEREELSVADARQRVADATAEAERRVQEATEYSAELIRRAAAQSHQRVAESDRAVQELSGLRSQVLDQLASLRDHLGQVDKLAASAPALLDPPEAEAQRPVTDDFPADPAGRPTELPPEYNSEPGPWDDVTVESVRADLGVPEPDSQTQPGQQAAHGGNAGGSNASGNNANGRALNGGAANGSEALEALAADFNAAEDLGTIPSAPHQDIAAEGAESQTDVFARIDEPIDERPNGDSNSGSNGQNGNGQGAGSSPAAVPGQQRSGLRAFAERAMGGR
jgi:cell division septum initiation protein DivIVA